MKIMNMKTKKIEVKKEERRNLTETKLKKAAVLSQTELFDFLQTDSNGLSDKIAKDRIEEYGLNEITDKNNDTWYKRLFNSFVNPFTIILVVLALISFITDFVIAAPEDRSLTAVIIIGSMVTLSGVLKFVQEGKSSNAGKKLREMIITTATVLRGGKEVEVPINELVPGDMIKLAAGDMIPADIRILSSKDLFISQASMTGESEPVEKFGKN